MSAGAHYPKVDCVNNFNWEASPGLDQNDDILADILEGTEGIPDLTTQRAEIPPIHGVSLGTMADPIVAVSGDAPLLAPYEMDFRCSGLSDMFESSTARCGGLNDVMKGRFHTAFDKAKLEALFSGLADSARISYQSSWLAWGAFALREAYPPGWRLGSRDEPLLGFSIWTSKGVREEVFRP